MVPLKKKKIKKNAPKTEQFFKKLVVLTGVTPFEQRLCSSAVEGRY